MTSLTKTGNAPQSGFKRTSIFHSVTFAEWGGKFVILQNPDALLIL